MSIKPGKVIVLNGTSSSGKSSLAKALQSQLNQPYLLCSLDMFWNMTPANMPAGSINFPNMKLAMAKSIKGLAEAGHNVIVDMIFCGNKTYPEFLNELESFDYSMVKVDCPLEELKKREKARGDRKLGLAESQFYTVHQGASYDVIIDTSDKTAVECAQWLIEKLEK